MAELKNGTDDNESVLYAPQGLIFSPVIHWHVAQNGLKAVDKQRGSTSRASPAHLPVF